MRAIVRGFGRGKARVVPALAQLVLGLCPNGPAAAHEFWLDMVDYRPRPGASVPVVFRTGESMLGDSYPYLKAGTRRFGVLDGGAERRIKATEGDDPAAEVRFKIAGLAILVFESADSEVVFETFGKFEENLKYEHLGHIVPEHRRRGLPETKIREHYVRCAKALVRVGHGRGEDRATGLPLEIVAEANPYQIEPGEPLGVRVLHLGKPVTGLTLKAFNRKDPQSPRSIPLDAEGRAKVELTHGGDYLLHVVHMQPAPAGSPAHWRSLWASLTFLRN